MSDSFSCEQGWVEQNHFRPIYLLQITSSLTFVLRDNSILSFGDMNLLKQKKGKRKVQGVPQSQTAALP